MCGAVIFDDLEAEDRNRQLEDQASDPLGDVKSFFLSLWLVQGQARTSMGQGCQRRQRGAWLCGGQERRRSHKHLMIELDFPMKINFDEAILPAMTDDELIRPTLSAIKTSQPP